MEFPNAAAWAALVDSEDPELQAMRRRGAETAHSGELPAAPGSGIANGDYMGFSSSASVLTLNNSAVNNNTAPNAGGGGVQNLLGTVTANSSTINGNTSLNGGGIASGNGAGGANPPPCTAQINLNNSQVIGNSAAHGGGIFTNGGSVTLSKTTVGPNTPDNFEPLNTIPGCTG